MRVIKWGNSLAVRLPASVVKALDLKEGDEVEIHVAGRCELAVVRKPNRPDLLERLRAFRGRLPSDFKFDREEANARSFERAAKPTLKKLLLAEKARSDLDLPERGRRRGSSKSNRRDL